jgi:hypothetical protein
MNDFKDCGGPAFPHKPKKWNPEGWYEGDANQTGYGISIRDWFAGMASGSVLREWSEVTPNQGETWHQMVARISYEHADAMLDARNADPA